LRKSPQKIPVEREKYQWKHITKAAALFLAPAALLAREAGL